MEISLAQFGQVFFYIPAGILVYLSREWASSLVWQRLHGGDKTNPVQEVDLPGMVSCFFSGVGWGGFCRSGRLDTIFTFMAAQLWFLVIITIAVFYCSMKNLAAGSFMASFFSALIFIAWSGFWVNLIPLPPFDASWFYMQPLQEIRIMVYITNLWKVIVAVLFSILLPLPDFLKGTFLLRWAGLV